MTDQIKTEIRNLLDSVSKEGEVSFTKRYNKGTCMESRKTFTIPVDVVYQASVDEMHPDDIYDESASDEARGFIKYGLENIIKDIEAS